MILVDSSVWIEFFRRRQPAYGVLTSLLGTRQVWAPECVFAELLQGAKVDSDRKVIQAMWEAIPRLETGNTLMKAGEESGRHRWFDRGVGLIDAWIIMAARANHSQIWSLDKKLNSVLQAVEIYSP